MRRLEARPILTWLLALTLLAAVPAAAGKKEPKLEIGPGPTAISPAERAIQEDPAAGVEHAVILVEETKRNENLLEDMETGFHCRLKILSNEGRDLANVEIPFDPKKDRLKEWWGRTLLPDGSVLELDQSQLEQQTVAKSGGRSVDVLKAAFPGVVPGCVVDYGYVLRERGYYPYTRIRMQREWPIREFRFLWEPTEFYQGAYFLVGTEKLDVGTEIGVKSILVTGRNLPPVKEEPLMPPMHNIRGSVVLYYMPRDVDFDDYWNDRAKVLERFVASSIKKRSVNEALDEMALPAEGDVLQRVRAAYDWMSTHVKRTGLQTYEEIERAEKDDDKKRDFIREVMEKGEGNAFEVQLVLVGVARALGADAHLVWVADRRDSLFNPNLKTTRQFDSTVVAIGSKGASDEQLVLADPCSGLDFGEVPWWYTGVHGILAAKEGGRVLRLPLSDVERNVARARVRQEFGEDNESLVVEWSKVGTGQVGLDERRYLRRLSPDDRAERIDRLCGSSPDVDVLVAEVAGLEELDRDLELRCETERFGIDIEDRVSEYRAIADGPWIPALPDVAAESRQYPLVFDFPRTDVADVVIGPPAGFVPDDPPEPVEIKSEFGRYVFRVERGEDGFRVHRELAVYPLMVPLDRYAEFRAFIESARRHDRTQLKFRREGASR